MPRLDVVDSVHLPGCSAALSARSQHATSAPGAPCTSVYATSHPDGYRSVRRLRGRAGLAQLQGRTHDDCARTHFQAQIVAARFGTIDVGVMRSTAHHRDNDGTNFGHNHPIHRLVIMVEGRATAELGGRTVDLTPGTGLLVPGETAMSYETTGTMTHLHVDIGVRGPRSAAVLGEVSIAYWAAPSPALEGLSAFAQTVLRNDDASLARSCRAEVERALEALTLTTIAGAPPLSQSDTVAHTTQFLAVEHIRRHFTEPLLTPAAVAAALGVSVRTLQRAFEGEPGPAESIARLRLDYALSLLHDERFDTIPVHEIATRAGYGSIAAMRRAVTAATGRGPADHRRSP